MYLRLSALRYFHGVPQVPLSCAAPSESHPGRRVCRGGTCAPATTREASRRRPVGARGRLARGAGRASPRVANRSYSLHVCISHYDKCAVTPALEVFSVPIRGKPKTSQTVMSCEI